ncbi:MAG: flagellar hook-associated protein FlgL [Candidatus Firestonebacteria bacterium]|nr:flagellar hook-associated protein FlgL [Candidatus Firestonebacteria bacterium]
MRVSGSMINSQIIENLNIDLARLQDLNNQISTGKSINLPSDDPLGSRRLVNINESLAGISQYQRNTQYVANWISASETTLTGTTSSLLQANSLAIRAANDTTLNAQDRNTMADQVNSILEQMVSTGNTQSEGKYIYGGFQTQAPPFQATRVAGEITAVTYVGDGGVEQVEIDSGLTVNKNMPGDQVFQPAAGTDVYATLINLRDALRAGNTAQIRTAISETDKAHTQVVTEVSQLGNKSKMMENTTNNLTAKKTALTKLSSEIGDTDAAAAIVKLSTAQNVYDAAMASSARLLNQKSLMDFLS